MTWYDVCARSDIPPERGWPVVVNGRPVAVFCARGRLFAVDNICRHIGAPLDEGFVHGTCLTCPWHGWRYDLVTGDHLTMLGGRPGLATYPVRTEGDRVLVAAD